MSAQQLLNPFRPGAGHVPPYLAGRDAEKSEFKKLLSQQVILSNLVLTGLRGVGKTVLLEELKPIAINTKWLWVGTDLSESTSVSEETIACRLIADLSVISSAIVLNKDSIPKGFGKPHVAELTLNYGALMELYAGVPGLVADKVKYLLEFVWKCVSASGVRGIVFAYDEAQTMSDHAGENQYPLSLLLDVFQSIQKKGIPFMLVMVGLPTLFPKLVVARTFSERMFTVQVLGKLSPRDSKEAILRPIADKNSAMTFSSQTVDLIVKTSGGYPYFIQFICKELFDVFLQQLKVDGKVSPLPMSEIVRKLDKDFFSGRWARATDRQRQLMSIISKLENCDEEFTVQDIVEKSKENRNPFSPSHVNQMLATLTSSGLIYKNRHGRYAFAVPLLGQFIQRQEIEAMQPFLPGIEASARR
jgi:hypothetical protein